MDIFSVLILTANFWVGWSYLVLASILAVEFNDRHIEPHYYGYILSAYSLSATFSPFFVNALTKIMGRSKVMQLGMLLMGASMIATGWVNLIQDNKTMIIAAILWRIFQGCFKTLIVAPSFSIIVIIHPDEKVKYSGLVEGSI